jgi:shikimate dehydrogenase
MMKRLAVLGHPVSHSRSPAMQTAALEALGLGAEWSYEAIDLEAAEFAGRTRELPSEGFAGVNVTIPHKEAALALADEASEAAAEIGAANTLSFATAGSRPTTPTPAAFSPPCRGRWARTSARSGSRRLRASGDLGARRPGRLGLGLEQDSRAADELVRGLARAGEAPQPRDGSGR